MPPLTVPRKFSPQAALPLLIPGVLDLLAGYAGKPGEAIVHFGTLFEVLGMHAPYALRECFRSQAAHPVITCKIQGSACSSACTGSFQRLA
jgi:hypothetical protein